MENKNNAHLKPYFPESQLGDTQAEQRVIVPLNGTEKMSKEDINKARAKFQELKKKFPQMKDKRIARKVDEYFKVKLI